jgi:alanine racemase
MEMFRRTYAEVNIENLVHNWSLIKNIAGDDRFICPMVKANAYGHGDVQVAQALEKEGALGLGVCLIEEGLLLRAAGIKTDILVFRGFDKRGAEKILEYQLIPVVSSWEQIYALESAADDPIKVHLKFDTGMNRLGFNSDQAEKLLDYFSKSKKLKLKAILTHLASGEDAWQVEGFSAQQLKKFAFLADEFKSRGVYSHVLNSGGICSLQKARKEGGSALLLDPRWGFRPGLMLYGYSPSTQFADLDLKPVMSLKSVVNNIRSVDIGESVSYGQSWVAERPSKIAVVPIGYADGVHRLASGSSKALFAGQKVNIVGRICMDFLMLDVTDVVATFDAAKNWIEEEIVLFGYDEKNNLLPASEMAQQTDTIVWETLTSVSERVPRHFKGLKKS